MSYPSQYQIRVLNTLAILGLSQVQITRTQNGFFKIRTSEPWKRFLYVILRINTGAKFLFLVLVSCGAFQSEFEFFEKMAILLWFLILLLLTISERLFYRKYPFFEILTAWWKTQEAVFNGLGKPEQFTEDVRKIGRSRVWFQGVVAVTGILAVVVQYDAAPKYCTFAYSLFKEESEALKWVTGLHEVLFLSHAWLVYGSVIYLSSVLGAEFKYSIDALQILMNEFTNHHVTFHSKSSNKITFIRVDNMGTSYINSKYTPNTLITEYKHVCMVMGEVNNFAGYNFLYMHACSYVQMVSDVFQMIQILRSPDADFLAVLFFAEDMMVCMYMLFRCFKSMAFVYPSTVDFIQQFKNFLSTPQINANERALFHKLRATIRPTEFRFGPCKVGPWTVGMAMDVLLQYYICVALCITNHDQALCNMLINPPQLSRAIEKCARTSRCGRVLDAFEVIHS